MRARNLTEEVAPGDGDFTVVIEDHDAQLSEVTDVRWDDEKNQMILVMGDKVEPTPSSQS